MLNFSIVVVGQTGRHCEIMRRKRHDGESALLTLGQALTAGSSGPLMAPALVAPQSYLPSKTR
jgi:hypothetical protein